MPTVRRNAGAARAFALGFGFAGRLTLQGSVPLPAHAPSPSSGIEPAPIAGLAERRRSS